MAFDHNEYIEALNPPTYVVDGRTFVGRILSLDEYVAHKGGFEKLRDGSMGYREWTAFVRRLVNDIFPPERRSLWQRLVSPRPKSVADYVLELPMKGQTLVVRDFCQSLATAAAADLSGSAELGTDSES